TYYRFRVMHLAQLTERRPPVFLFRGGRTITDLEITTQSLRPFADDLASNLRSRVHAGEGGAMSGTYLPAQGRLVTPLADTREQTLAAMALAEYADLVRLQNKPEDAPHKEPPDTASLAAASDLLSSVRNDAM